MKQNFTLNQLTRLLYEETTPEESAMLLELTELCPPLGEQFEEMRSNKQILDELVLSPSPQSVNKILAYSSLQTA